MRHAALGLASLATTISPAAAAEPVVLEPGSKWSADFAKDKCRLVRFFGPESARNVMILEQYDPGERFGLVVGGPAFDAFKAGRDNTVRFLAEAPPTKAEPLVGPLDGYGRSLFFLSMAMKGPDPDKAPAKRDAEAAAKSPALLDPALAAQVRFVEVAVQGRAVRLMTGPLDSAVKVMNQCMLDLVGTWGLDPEQHRTATRRPMLVNERATLEKLYSHIPWQRLDNGNGTDALRIRLITGADGTIEGCTLVENTDPKIGAKVCKGLARARVQPGLDAAGQPMRSYLPITIYVGAPISTVQVVGI